MGQAIVGSCGENDMKNSEFPGDSGDSPGGLDSLSPPLPLPIPTTSLL